LVGACGTSPSSNSTQLFIERTKDFAKTDKVAIEHILKRSNYNFTITPKEETKVKIIKSSNKTLQAARLTATNFAQYYLHGVFEFGYLYNNYKKNHYYGAYTFNILVKFINTIFRTYFDIKEIQNAPTRTGIYTTFFGPIFIDFGWFSLIFMFFFGVFQKLLFNKTMAGRFQFIPLLFYMLIINFFMALICCASIRAFFVFASLMSVTEISPASNCTSAFNSCS
jgi:hypothetical protein